MENHASQIAFYARLVDDSVVCASDIDSIVILSDGLKIHGRPNWFGKWLVEVGVGMKQNNLLLFWTSSFFIAVG